MNPLFFEEWRRMRKPSAMAGALLLFGLCGAIFSASMAVEWLYQFNAMAILAGLVAIGLGVYQALPYRAAASWSWLCMRPLSAGQRFANFAAVGVLMILLSVTLPHLLLSAILEISGRDPFDPYHLTQIALMSVHALSMWAAGIIATWHPRTRLAATAPLILIPMANTDAQLVMSITGLLLVMLACTYRLSATDRHAASRKGLTTVLQAALCLVPAFAFCAALASNAPKQWLKDLIEPIPADGKQEHLLFWASPSTFNLNKNKDASARLLAKQAIEKPMQAEYTYASPPDTQVWKHARAQSLRKPAPQFSDRQHDVTWRYNFRRQQFHGTRLTDGSDSGWLAGAPYAETPTQVFADAEQVLLTDGRRLDRYALQSGTISTVLHAPPGQGLRHTLLKAGDTFLLMADRELLLVPKTIDAAHPLQHIALPNTDSLRRLDFTRIGDLYLITQTHVTEDDKATRQLASTTQVISVSGQALHSAFSRLAWPYGNYEYLPIAFPMNWLVPLLYETGYNVPSWTENGVPSNMNYAQELLTRLRLAVAAISAALAGLWLYGSAMTRFRRTIWVLAAAAFGPPLLIAMAMLEPGGWTIRPRSLPMPV